MVVNCDSSFGLEIFVSSGEIIQILLHMLLVLFVFSLEMERDSLNVMRDRENFSTRSVIFNDNKTFM
jgi:hypothetical protein